MPFGKILRKDIHFEHRKEKTEYSDRNLRIYEKMLEEGQKLDAREQFYYGRELFYHGKYEEAIKAYQELSQPPGTLYNIADCQKRLKKSQEALRTYAEIAGSFPREAPNAFWHMGEYYRQLGDQKRAVATYRAILRRHPKSPQASWSHQVLDRLGIDETGLGADEDF